MPTSSPVATGGLWWTYPGPMRGGSSRYIVPGSETEGTFERLLLTNLDNTAKLIPVIKPVWPKHGLGGSVMYSILM